MNNNFELPQISRLGKRSFYHSFSLSLLYESPFVRIRLLNLLLLTILITPNIFSITNLHTGNDTLKEKRVQYRRGISIDQFSQSYDDKYHGINLSEEKKRLFPFGYETNNTGKITSATGVWTEINPKVPRVDYLGIGFVNKDTGWACGDLGALIKTSDGGKNWITINTPTTSPLLKVRSYNGQIVIASGFNGLILRSTDGGETFTQIPSGVTGDLWGLQMLNDSLGWASGNMNSFIKTTDGGQTWQLVTNTGLNTEFWWIDFINDNYGFIACSNGIVLKTTDGGNNWMQIQAGDNNQLFTINVIDSMHISAAGNTGKHVYSKDGGISWVQTPLFQLPNEPVNCVKYVNIDTGYSLVGETGIYKTTNRGSSWQTTAGKGEFEMQIFPIEKIGYSSGTGLKIDKAEGNFDVWRALIINDDFADVFFTNEQRGFVISGGQNGRVYKTTNAGISWTSVSVILGGESITFTDSLTGYIGTFYGQVYKTTNGGEIWHLTNGITEKIIKIFFISSKIGWAVGGYRIFKTIDGGENWFEQLYNIIASFQSIYFVDSLFGWTAGARPYRTTNGGENWIQQTNMNFYNIDDIYFINRNTGWLGKYSSINPSLYKTTDGGLTWLAIPMVVGARKFNFFPDPIHWIINGFSRRYITVDGGNSWIEFTNAVPNLNSFQAPTNYLGYAVGKLGLIFKYHDTTYVPVELVSFEGRIDNEGIILSWVTASELNNQGFYIEKSMDKINWETIGFTNGKGTTIKTSYYNFADREPANGKIYYRLRQLDYDGSIKYSKIIKVYFENIPLNFKLFQNYPNPFNSTTIISFQIPQKSFINISIYDIKGEKITELLNKEKEEGVYKITFEVKELPSGIYFIRMITSAGFSAVDKITLIK